MKDALFRRPSFTAPLGGPLRGAGVYASLPVSASVVVTIDRGEMNWVVDFQRAADDFDWESVRTLATQYVAHLGDTERPASPSERNAVLEILRDHRRYDEVGDVVDALLSQGIDDAAVRRHYGQALVERGNPAAALLTFRAIAQDPGASHAERFEARGSVGRCNKELYLRTTDRARRAQFLHDSLAAYRESYEENPNGYWSGINVVALLSRAEREGVALPWEGSPGDAQKIARDVLDVVSEERLDDAWAQATAVEACVALGETQKATEHLEYFLTLAKPKAFTLNSLLRQLTEVWQLVPETAPGTTLLAQLRSELLRKSGGVVDVGPREVRTERLQKLATSGLEKVLGNDRYLTMTWYIKGLERCRAVARIETSNAAPVGTGFLVSGKSLHPHLPDIVLMTNGHVVPGQISAANAVVTFRGADAGGASVQTFRVVRQWWSDGPEAGHLDTTLLELDSIPESVEPVPLAAGVPDMQATVTPRAYVIGHPLGREQPQFSLQDNKLLAIAEKLLHYRSPTDPGSSGSPVFDEDWNLIGIHHAGRDEMPRLDGEPGVYGANEGIRLSAIIDELRLLALS